MMGVGRGLLGEGCVVILSLPQFYEKLPITFGKNISFSIFIIKSSLWLNL